MGGSDPPPRKQTAVWQRWDRIKLPFQPKNSARENLHFQRLKIKLPLFHVSKCTHTHTYNIRCIFGVKITRVEAQQGQRPVRLWGERKRIAKSRERERERGRRWTLAPEPRVSGVASRVRIGGGERRSGGRTPGVAAQAAAPSKAPAPLEPAKRIPDATVEETATRTRVAPETRCC